MSKKQRTDTIFRRSTWRRRTFLRIFSATLGLGLLVLMASSFVYYRNLEQVTVEQITEASIQSLTRTRSVFSAIHLWLGATIRQVRSDPAVERFLSGLPSDQAVAARSKNVIETTKRHYPWIHSIYLYNHGTETLVSTIAGKESKPYSDPDLMRLLLNPVQPESYAYVPRSIRYDAAEAAGVDIDQPDRVNVFTVFVDNRAGEPGKPGAWLVVNLDARRIRQDFFSRFMEQTGDMLIVRQDGLVISHEDESLFRINIARRGIIDRILSSPQSQGAGIHTINGANRLVSYVSFEELRWYFVNIADYDQVLSQIRRVRRITVLVASALLGFSTVLAFLISRKIYSPIDGLFRFAQNVGTRLQLPDREPLSHPKSELQYLDEVFHRVADKVDDLQTEDLLKQLLEGRPEVDSADAFAVHPPSVGTEAIAIAVVRLDEYQAFLEQLRGKEIRRLFQHLKTYIADFIPVDHRFVDMGSDHVAIILSVGQSESEEHLLQGVADQLRDIQTELHERFTATVTIGLSTIVNEPEELPQAYREAYSATRYRFRYGHGSVIRFDLSAEAADRTYSFPEETVRAMLHSVRTNNLNAALADLDTLLADISGHSPEDFGVFVHFVKYMAIKTLFDSTSMNVPLMVEANRLIQSVDRAETMQIVRQTFAESFRRYAAGLTAYQDAEKIQLIHDVRAFISRNLDDPNLSADLVSDNVRMSTNYLRRIFKEYTGDSLSAYITQQRIDLCRKLLVETNDTVKQIFRRAGFANYSNFFTTFKRLTGRTPLDYRKANSPVT